MMQIDVPIAFSSGTVLAAASAPGLRSSKAGYFYFKGLATSLLFQIFAIVWFPIYLMIKHFGVETSHMWWTKDSVMDYPWLPSAFIIVYFAANVGGFHLGTRLAARGALRQLWTIFWVAIVFSLLWMGLQPYRTLSLGTYDQWVAGTSPWLSTDRVLTGMLYLWTFLFVLVHVAIYRSLKREGMVALAADRG